jgi:hypothetical protein
VEAQSLKDYPIKGKRRNTIVQQLPAWSPRACFALRAPKWLGMGGGCSHSVSGCKSKSLAEARNLFACPQLVIHGRLRAFAPGLYSPTPLTTSPIAHPFPSHFRLGQRWLQLPWPRSARKNKIQRDYYLLTFKKEVV